MKSLHGFLDHGIPTKVNAVIIEGKNDQDILPLAEFARDHKVDVRFIEEMPFNGEGSHYPVLVWNHKKIHEVLKSKYPDMKRVADAPHSTSMNYQIPGFRGKVGIIAAFSRTFCGACNRIRLTAKGTLKTCLYDEGVLDLKALMRNGADDDVLKEAFLKAFASRAKDGFEAEARRVKGNSVSESMSTIGG
jgi:cyclic pyranopterin phosphate synthase